MAHSNEENANEQNHIDFLQKAQLTTLDDAIHLLKSIEAEMPYDLAEISNMIHRLENLKRSL